MSASLAQAFRDLGATGANATFASVVDTARDGGYKHAPNQRILAFTLSRPAMGYNIAVVGATGNVGREMLSILNERQFPVNELYAVASRRSLGVEVSFGDTTLKCKDLATFDFSGVVF